MFATLSVSRLTGVGERLIVAKRVLDEAYQPSAEILRRDTSFEVEDAEQLPTSWCEHEHLAEEVLTVNPLCQVNFEFAIAMTDAGRAGASTPTIIPGRVRLPTIARSRLICSRRGHPATEGRPPAVGNAVRSTAVTERSAENRRAVEPASRRAARRCGRSRSSPSKRRRRVIFASP